MGVYELLQVDDPMRHLIVEKAPHDELRALAVENGMRSLREEALRLVAENVTTVNEILRSVYPL
jgi:type IV pilus assembly protein PilB